MIPSDYNWTWRLDDTPRKLEDVVDAYRLVQTQEPWNEVVAEDAATATVEQVFASDTGIGFTATPEGRGPYSETSAVDEAEFPENPSYVTVDGEEPPDEERFFDEVDDPVARGFTWAYDAEEAAELLPDSDELQEYADGDTAYIAELGVVPGYQGQDIPADVTSPLLDELGERYDRAVVDAGPAASDDRDLYRRLGFEPVEERDGGYLVREFDGDPV